jgi:flagellar basal-body rod protein FlgG
MTQTNNQLDLAVQGKGYFQVLMPSGETAYTRAGNFSVNATGVLVTDQGYQILPQVTIPSNATAVSIASSGLVQATVPGSTTPTTVGQMELATFVNEAGLEAQGENLFQVSGASGPAVTGVPGSPGFGTVLQGYTEASNVDAVTEITSLIAAQRAYEMNSKVISTADQMMATTAQVKS